MLQTIENDSIAITLKEITDLISIEHNKAMKQVYKLSNEPSFGGVEKIATPTFNPNGSFNRNIETYILNKKQAIAISAKLNDTMLMKVIDRLEELEHKQNRPLTYEETMQNALLLADKRVKALEHKIQEDVPLVAFASTVKSSTNSVLIRDWVKSIGLREKDARIWLNEKGYIYRNKQKKWCVFATNKAKKYFEAVPTTQSTTQGTFVNYTIKIKGEGQTNLTDLILKDLIK